MEIECFGFDCINWVKASEIIFEGIIIGVTVILAYVLGRIQSDRNWKRELLQREKEQKEKEENEIDLRRIDKLVELQELISRHIPPLSRVNYLSPERNLCLENVKELIIELDNVMPLFGTIDNEIIHNDLVLLSQRSQEFKMWIERAIERGINVDASGYENELYKSKSLYNKEIQNIIEKFG